MALVPKWARPPADLVGKTLGLDLRLVDSPDLQVVARSAVVFPNGFLVDIVLRYATERRIPTDDLLAGWVPASQDVGQFRFSVELADGRVSTSLEGPSDDHLSIVPQTGLGTGSGYDLTAWVSPLPQPGGPLALSVTWPAEGIHGGASLDTGRLLELARSP
jgi:hypothetical protein